MLKTCSKTYNRPAQSLCIAPNANSRFVQVAEAIMLTNKLLANPEFYYRIAAHPGFDMADVSPEIIAGLMCETSLKMSVNLYYATNSQLNIDGYDDVNNPSNIHLNIWKIHRTAASICNSLIHSCVHAVNEYNRFYYFGHGDRSPRGKESTAPYWIGALAQSMVTDEDCMLLPLEHDPAPPFKKPMALEIDMVHKFSQSLWLTC